MTWRHLARFKGIKKMCVRASLATFTWMRRELTQADGSTRPLHVNSTNWTPEVDRLGIFNSTHNGSLARPSRYTSIAWPKMCMHRHFRPTSHEITATPSVNKNPNVEKRQTTALALDERCAAAKVMLIIIVHNVASRYEVSAQQHCTWEDWRTYAKHRSFVYIPAIAVSVVLPFVSRLLAEFTGFKKPNYYACSYCKWDAFYF